MAEAPAVRPMLPASRRLEGATVITIGHFPDDTSARAALECAGLDWPERAGALHGHDPYVLWRSPKELLALSSAPASAALKPLLRTLAAGENASAVAIDLSEATVILELHGPQLDTWLEHLVDACAIPRVAPQATRCRLADAAVVLLRLDPERLWLVADRALAAYIQDWLAFAHDGAFAVST